MCVFLKFNFWNYYVILQNWATVRAHSIASGRVYFYLRGTAMLAFFPRHRVFLRGYHKIYYYLDALSFFILIGLWYTKLKWQIVCFQHPFTVISLIRNVNIFRIKTNTTASCLTWVDMGCNFMLSLSVSLSHYFGGSFFRIDCCKNNLYQCYFYKEINELINVSQLISEKMLAVFVIIQVIILLLKN